MIKKVFFWASIIFFHSFCCFASEIQYIDTTQNFGTYVSKIAFGDLDNDGDLDVFVNHHDYRPNKVWLNDGSANFSDSGQNLGSSYSVGIDLADLDGDGDLDAFVGNFFMNNQQNKVWLNDGSGNFSDSGQSLGNLWTTGIGLGDLDDDGDADAFVVNTFTDKIWFNDGSGNFSDSGQSLGTSPSNEVKLGDLDGDGDLDAFIANVQYTPNTVWFNDGSGNFIDSGQSLGARCSTDAELGDVDSDGDLDVFVSNYDSEPNIVWLNNGNGFFSDSGQRLGSSVSEGVSLGDLDNDGDLDAIVVNISEANEIWFNDGSGNFSVGNHNIGSGTGMGHATIGDLDSNGALDVVLSTEGGSSIFLASLNEDECLDESDCSEGYACLLGSCELQDQPPEFLSEPLWVGPFVGLSTDPANPHIPQSQHVVFWAYDDDGLACNGSGISPENRWMYRPIELQDGGAVPQGDWIVKTPGQFMWYVWIDAPTLVETIPAPGLYEFKMQVTDCLGQVTDSVGFWGSPYYIQIDP